MVHKPKRQERERDTPILEIVTVDISVSRLFLFRTHSQLLRTQNINKEKTGILLYGPYLGNWSILVK